jgi:hypothetical protein
MKVWGSYLKVRLPGRFDADKPRTAGTSLGGRVPAIDGVEERDGLADRGPLSGVCRRAHCQVELVVLVNAKGRVDFGGKVS